VSGVAAVPLWSGFHAARAHLEEVVCRIRPLPPPGFWLPWIAPVSFRCGFQPLASLRWLIRPSEPGFLPIDLGAKARRARTRGGPANLVLPCRWMPLYPNSTVYPGVPFADRSGLDIRGSWTNRPDLKLGLTAGHAFGGPWPPLRSAAFPRIVFRLLIAGPAAGLWPLTRSRPRAAARFSVALTPRRARAACFDSAFPGPPSP